MNTNMERAMDYYREAGSKIGKGADKVIDCVFEGFEGWCRLKISQAFGIGYAFAYSCGAVLYTAKGTAIVAKEVGKYGLNKTKKVIEKTAEYKAGKEV